MVKNNKYLVQYFSHISSLRITREIETYNEANAVNLMLEEYPETDLNGWSAWLKND